VEQYLRKCVDSLLAQDYDDYEIILVDDGSPDSCPQICEEYVEKAKSGKLRAKSGADVPLTSDIQHQTSGFITVIHRENGGLSAARNSGIEVARGEYIMFVDSDDYLEPNVLGTLMAQVERDNLDVLRFNYQNVRVNSEGEYEPFHPYKSPHQVDGGTDVVSGETYLDERMGYACYAWQFILRRDWIYSSQSSDIQHQTSDIAQRVLFTPGIHFEDTEWLPRMMLQAKRVGSTPMVVYNYFVREGSITQTKGNPAKVRKNVEDCMTVIERYAEYMKQHPECNWLRRMQSNMVVSVIANVAQYLYAERNEYLTRMKSLGVFPLSLEHQGSTYLRKARLINFSPRMAIMLLHLKNK
jgi:glycosyltransferase involved in cell wall biosynthesis